MRRLRIIENFADLQQVRSLWNALYQSLGDRVTLFQTFALNELAAQLFADRERPYVVIAENDSGAAIIPACIRQTDVSFLGEELFDYREVLSNDDAALSHAWQEIDRLGAPVEVKAARGPSAWGENCPFAAAPFWSAAADLARNKKLERSTRLLQQSGCEFHTFDAASKVALVRQMYVLKSQQASGGLFRHARRIDAVVGMAERWPAQIHVCSCGGEIVAAALTFLDGRVCRFYGTYYDPHWASLSPGIALLYRLVREAQSHGFDFDFMTGEQPYKLRFATGRVPLFIARRAAREAVTAA